MRRGAWSLVVVLAIKIVVLMQIGHHPLLAPTGELDGAFYYHFAERAAHGDSWLLSRDSFFGHPAPPFFISPLYIYFLALCLKVFGSLDAARFVQIVLGTAAVGVLAITARHWYGNRAAWWTGALAAFCGLFTFHEVIVLQASLDPFLTALDLYFLTRAIRNQRPLDWAAAGAALGLHALNRPNMLFVAAGLAALSLFGKSTSRTKLAGVVAFVATAIIVISPATIRNWRASGEFVLISSHGGLNFLIGNGPQADGTFTQVMDIQPSITGQWLGAAKAVGDAIGHEPSAGEISPFFFRQSFAWIRAHPGAELALAARKTWYALSATFLTLNHNYQFFAYDLHTLLAVLFVGPVALLPLGLVGLTVARPRQPGFLLWAAYVPLSIASVVVFFIAARYRLPFQVAMTIPAGGAIAWGVDLVRGRLEPRTFRSGVQAGIALITAAVVVIWPTGLDDGRAEEQAGQGLLDLQAGRASEGEAWLQRALTHHAVPGVLHARAGQVYEAMDRLPEALTHYRQAVAIDPNEPAPHFVLGRTLFRARQDAEALGELARAVPGPQEESAKGLQVLALSRLGRREEADRLMHTLDPARWDVDQARGFATSLIDAGRVDLSIIAWRRAADASGVGRDSEQLGLAWARLGRDADAAAAFAEAVARSPASPSAHLNHGVALAALGRIQDARREAQTALKLAPQYQRARDFLTSISR